MASSSSASSFRSWKYDVFLSFRGENTRKTFVDHLYKALQDRLIRTYKDDITLLRGESVGPALLEAIEESHFAVIVFSKNYADSSWCLDELVHIMKCREDMGLTVFPVFYDIDPSEVRYQKREFGVAFSKQVMKNITKAKSWRKALVDASNISGWEPKNFANGHEAAVIQNIIDAISDKLLLSYPYIDGNYVGMTDRVKDLISRLQIGTGGVRMVGIWGIGGGGKTALATSVYMQIKDCFQGHCIVDNSGEESNKHNFKTQQEKLLNKFLKTKVEVQSEEEGKCMIKDRLCHSNVLILLDNVNDSKQLEALVGSKKWFGDGSRIIITTRNQQLLNAHRVDYISRVRLLSNDEALLLFKRYAYNEMDPVEDYDLLSVLVVSYAAGLPLALKVLGSFLSDKDNKGWMSTLHRLKDIPEGEIMEMLKISYDGLKPVEKELFLDIACFFRGRSTGDAMEIFDACGFHPDIGLTVLIQKALLSIDSDGRFDMHDLVQMMGHYIVRGGEHPDNLEKHSRVWKKEDIINMCLGDTTMENHATEVMIIYNIDSPLPYSRIVSNMKRLRWLIFCKCSSEAPDFLSNELRYIKWFDYPASPFLDGIQLRYLVVLKMERSLQKEMWMGCKYLPNLKVLQLKKSKLVSTPDFDGLPSLQKLQLYECDDLEEIHPSLGNHKRLKHVTVSCSNLKKFPAIDRMTNLEALYINHCHMDFAIPEIQSNMENLVMLTLRAIGIQVFLSSAAVHCPNLISLRMSEFYTLDSINVNVNWCRHLTHSLRELCLSNCGFQDGDIPSQIRDLSNLHELDLSRNDFSRLDFSLSQLTRLIFLNLSECNRLVELPELPSSLVIFVANKCDRLRDIQNFNRNCEWLCQVSVRDGGILNDGDRLLQSMLKGKAIENHSMVLLLEGLQIPREFRPRLRAGWKCTLQLPECWCHDFCGFLMCAVIKDGIIGSPEITMKQVRGDYEDDVDWEESVDDKGTWVGYVSFGSLRHTKWWDELITYKQISFSISFPSIDLCSGLGVTLVPRTSGSGPTDASPPEYYSEVDEQKYDFKPKFWTRNYLKCTFEIPSIILPSSQNNMAGPGPGNDWLAERLPGPSKK